MPPFQVMFPRASLLHMHPSSRENLLTFCVFFKTGFFAADFSGAFAAALGGRRGLGRRLWLGHCRPAPSCLSGQARRMHHPCTPTLHGMGSTQREACSSGQPHTQEHHVHTARRAAYIHLNIA